MKRGDTQPPLKAKLYDLADEDFYHSDISVVVRHEGNKEVVVSSPIDDRDLQTGEVVYYWSKDGSDLPYTGTYQVEFEVNRPDGTTEHYPSDGYLTFTVEETLNNL